MAEYIEREALLEKLQTVEKEVFKNGYYNGQLHFEAVSGKDIVSAPAADVVPVVHGRWEKEGTGITERFVCSNCKSEKGSFMRPPFCNQCGARMDGE